MGFEYQINEEISLRLFESRHAEELFQLTMESSIQLREWLPWVDYIKETNDSRLFIENSLKQFSQNNGFQAGIWYRGALAGVIGLHEINWANKTTSIGYWLGTNYIGKGLMTESCKAIIQYCFEELDLNRIEIRAATGNKKSQAIPERLGFLQEGCIRSGEFLYDRFVDHYVYGLLKSDSKATK